MTNFQRTLLVSTTSTLDGWTVQEYLGPVTAQFVLGTGLFTEFFSGFTDFFGAHSKSHQGKLERIGEEALQQIKAKASQLLANAVLGLRIDYDEISGAGKSLLMVTASGTAVRVERTNNQLRAGVQDRPHVDAAAMSAMVQRHLILRQAADGQLNWSDQRTWELVLSHQLSELTHAFLNFLESTYPMYVTASDDPGYVEIKTRFEQFFLSLQFDDARRELYQSLDRHWRTAELAIEMLKDIHGFDRGLIEANLGSGSVRRRTRIAGAAMSNMPVYRREDLADLEAVAASFDDPLERLPSRDVPGMFGSKRIRTCVCGRDIPADTTTCECRADAYGREHFVPERSQVAERLRLRVELLRKAWTEQVSGGAVQ